jgi:flagellar hook-associated protein 2
MSFSSLTGQFTVQANQTGENGAITGTFTNWWATRTGSVGANAAQGFSVANNGNAARNAEFMFNNAQMSRETNNFTVEGISVSLNPNLDTSAGAVNFDIAVGRDISEVRNFILSFIDEFNEIVGNIQSLTETRRPRTDGGRGFFMPLTQEQRRAMSQSEIDQWEEQARTGLLHRDDMLRRILSDMRQEMERVVTVNGQNISLANIGILPSRNVSQGGILEINMEALDKALADNMEGVAGLFTGEGVTHVDGRAVSGTLRGGIGARLDTALNRYVTEWGTGELSDRAGIVGRPSQHNNAITRQIQDQDRRIDDMMNWLQRREAALFKQFSRLEVAMLQSQQQMMFWDQIMWGG